MKKVYHNHKGSKNPNWKGGKPKCINCGKEISRPSKKCRQCASKDRRGKRSWAYKNRGKRHPLYGIRGEKYHAWEGGKASPKKCIDCGKKIKYSSKRCKVCANIRCI